MSSQGPVEAAASREFVRELGDRFCDVRLATERLCEPLDPEDAGAQSMPCTSPTKWHLAHTSWFFETFVIEPAVPEFRRFHADFSVLFNSYYNAVGEQHPRPERGLLTRPTLREVLEYREHVDQHVAVVLQKEGLEQQLAERIELGLHHEQQHQELILTDIKHLFAQNPLRPAFAELEATPEGRAGAVEWLEFDEELQEIGLDLPEFGFDNERPRHRALVHGFEIASRLVTNGEFAEFVEAGGYALPEFWLSDGWATVLREGWRAPLYWQSGDAGWQQFTLGGVRDLRADEPLCHVSYYEADAYARWRGERLPTEAEWEVAASRSPEGLRGNFVESGLLRPAASIGSQFFGDVWEWTRSPYAPYPGYKAPAGAVGEYNGKFMANQIVLRGGSCATPRSHIRPSYRNFFYPGDRWQFSGLRLARDS